MSKLVLNVVFLVVVVAVIFFFLHGQSECSDAGGEYVRGLFGMKCIVGGHAL